MKFITKTLAALSFAIALPAMAGQTTGGIVAFDVRNDGVVYITLDVTTGHHSCAGAVPYWVVKDETTVAGKAQIAALMGAYLSGRTVTIYGNSTCTRMTSEEDIYQISVL